jgi:hypothetical protein
MDPGDAADEHDLINVALAEPGVCMAFFTGTIVFRNRSLLSSSKRALVSDSEKLTPSKSASTSTRTWCWLLITRSHSRRSFPSARPSREMSRPCLRLTSLMKWSMMRWSKSSPPRWVSPLVASTSKTPSSMSLNNQFVPTFGHNFH